MNPRLTISYMKGTETPDSRQWGMCLRAQALQLLLSYDPARLT